MISKRKLIKYRKDALQFKEDIKNTSDAALNDFIILPTIVQLDRLLELTQELIDQHLLGEK